MTRNSKEPFVHPSHEEKVRGTTIETILDDYRRLMDQITASHVYEGHYHPKLRASSLSVMVARLNYMRAKQEINKPSEMRLRHDEFCVLNSLMMCSDPWPLENSDGLQDNYAYEVITRLMDKEASARGYDTWTDAYHDKYASEDAEGFRGQKNLLQAVSNNEESAAGVRSLLPPLGSMGDEYHFAVVEDLRRGNLYLKRIKYNLFLKQWQTYTESDLLDDYEKASRKKVHGWLTIEQVSSILRKLT